MRTFYIAFGSNLNQAQMKHRCPTANIIGASVLEGYQLLFRGRSDGAHATIEKQEGGTVPVLVWELKPLDEQRLDNYEGYPTYYRKETVKVKIGKSAKDVMVYIMNEGQPFNRPNGYYYNIILEGYKTAGFDEDILINASSLSTPV